MITWRTLYGKKLANGMGNMVLLVGCNGEIGSLRSMIKTSESTSVEKFCRRCALGLPTPKLHLLHHTERDRP